MLHRTIKSETGLKWRVYKFDNEDEFNTFLHDTNKYFKASTTLLSSGRFRTAEMNFIESLADDLAYKDINLTQSDLFVITKENTSAKLADEERKVKLIKRASKVEETTEKGKRGRKSSWTPEELGLIWTDTVENIAKHLGKSISSVSLQRRIFLSENPGFIIPEVAKKQKSAKVDKPTQNEDWTAEQTALLWSKPAMMLSQEIGKTFREIGRKRIEWCLANPDFIIPYIAQFNSKGLTNKVERKRRTDGWTTEQENLIWEDNIENLVSVLGRSYHAIYMKRQEFLAQNPGFIIPECAKTIKTSAKKITHPIQEIKEAAKADTVATTLFGDAGSGKTIEVKKPEVKTKRPYNRKPKEVENNSIKQVADFLNQLSKMPKKIKMNGIELEF
jgi:hypothetical protein